VADFIGDVNLIEARVGKGKTLDSDIGAIRATGAKAKAGDTVWLALRPAKMRISCERPTDVDNVVEGTVHDIAYLGDLSLYRVRLAGGRELKVTEANQSRRVARPIARDDKVFLSWAPDAGVVLTR
jgi:putrescine transport system ATP-binding protein